MRSGAVGEDAGERHAGERRGDAAAHDRRVMRALRPGSGPTGAASEPRCVMRITRPAASSEISPAVMNADW